MGDLVEAQWDYGENEGWSGSSKSKFYPVVIAEVTPAGYTVVFPDESATFVTEVREAMTKQGIAMRERLEKTRQTVNQGAPAAAAAPAPAPTPMLPDAFLPAQATPSPQGPPDAPPPVAPAPPSQGRLVKRGGPDVDAMPVQVRCRSESSGSALPAVVLAPAEDATGTASGSADSVDEEAIASAEEATASAEEATASAGDEPQWWNIFIRAAALLPPEEAETEEAEMSQSTDESFEIAENVVAKDQRSALR